ncbi:hypothetical protein Leryth_020136 [Lithospermum erythrorhizon]|nr:hypothetical protein Leryth_020136 [Lithospermum erythrorhizon]
MVFCQISPLKTLLWEEINLMWFGTRPAVLMTEPVVKGSNVKVYIYEKLLKTNQSTFHQDKVKNMLPAFSLSCLEMVTKWEKIVQTEEPVEIDVWPHLQTLTSDAISRTAFGSNYEEGRKIFELQTEQAKLVSKLLFAIRLFLAGG